MRGLEALEHGGKEIRANGQRRRDSHRPRRRRTEIVDRLACEGDGVKELFGARPEGASGRGQGQASPTALE